MIAINHDQGHAVFKTLPFDEGVNVTVGLPTIRVGRPARPSTSRGRASPATPAWSSDSPGRATGAEVGEIHAAAQLFRGGGISGFDQQRD